MKITKSQLQRIIRETINEVSPEHMPYGETPEGGLDPEYTREEDVRFTQQLKAEETMKRAGLTSEEISRMWPAIEDPGLHGEFFYGGDSSYEKLYRYFEHPPGDEPAIPYEIISQSGSAQMDPGEWILEYLGGRIAPTEEEPHVSLAAEQKNRKITKAKLRNIVKEELNAVITEAWKGDPTIEQTGKWAAKTKEWLCAMRSTLKNKKERTDAETEELRQINSAIKQKGPKSGKVDC